MVNQLLTDLDNLKLTVVLGRYAQGYHFKNNSGSVTELVKSGQDHWPSMIPLPHPSPRNNIWLRRNPWFEIKLLLALQNRVEEVF
jgi:uracil-DNA glycosylase